MGEIGQTLQEWKGSSNVLGEGVGLVKHLQEQKGLVKLSLGVGRIGKTFFRNGKDWIIFFSLAPVESLVNHTYYQRKSDQSLLFPQKV